MMAQYDIQYTPLLPSQLLMGSPFQPGTPAFTPLLQQGHDMTVQAVTAAASYDHSASAYYAGTLDYDHASQRGSRTVYIGNLPKNCTLEQLLDHVHSGVVEQARIVPEKYCAFVSFLDHVAAAHFHSDANLKRLSVGTNHVKIGWGKSGAVPSHILAAINQDGASRNVYLGALPADISTAELRDKLQKYGQIDTVKMIPERGIAFVHFASIAAAIRCVQSLPSEPDWAERKVFYGKDRCAYVSKTQQQNAAQYLGIMPGYEHMLGGTDRELLSTAIAQQTAAAVAVATAAGGVSNVGNRTLYFGSLHPDTTIEEICNVIRGGLLQHIRYIPEKHICFVAFVDPTAAAQFFAMANLQGLQIHARKVKIGWGKHSGPLPHAIALAVTAGASRNVYIGNIENWPEERLRSDFGRFGEMEQINFLPEKSCAFVNFTNITSAIKAIEGMKQNKDYANFKINYGKDRCGNPPRTLMVKEKEDAASKPYNQMTFLPSAESRFYYTPIVPQSAVAAASLYNYSQLTPQSPYVGVMRNYTNNVHGRQSHHRHREHAVSSSSSSESSSKTIQAEQSMSDTSADVEVDTPPQTVPASPEQKSVDASISVLGLAIEQ